MVLKVDLQCYRCYQKKYDEKANTVTITVVSIDPQCIKTKISSKAGSCIKSIEIKPPEKKAPTETKDKDKPPKKEPETKIVWILCKVMGGSAGIVVLVAAARLHVKVAVALRVADAATGRPGHAAVVVVDTDTDTTIAGVAEGATAPLAEDAKALFRLYVRGAAAFGARVVVVVVDHVVVGGAAVVMMGVNIKRQVIVHPCEVESG
ncbi:hypothetical protein PVK06_021283 [Gossypium arboreum]|uniref:Uncharacterized protein n=1 Tax=Gossypium arboreum TaxID=29729 RepID=A0ABR0PQB1_GOSAR|nr:hypothetical protein PVK06_021283 [Gossypium arboreum]